MLSYLAEHCNDLLDTRNKVCTKLPMQSQVTTIKSYRLVATLEGHGGLINTFAFNVNGTLLASGGDDEEVQIWDLQVFRPYQKLADRSRTWGQITCIKFLNVEPSPMGELLCFGTERGYLLLYHRQRKTVSI